MCMYLMHVNYEGVNVVRLSGAAVRDFLLFIPKMLLVKLLGMKGP